jgi:hypothetical protein
MVGWDVYGEPGPGSSPIRTAIAQSAGWVVTRPAISSGFDVSEGDLNSLTAHGMQVGASEDTESPSEQGLMAPGRQSGGIREQLDTSAPVSREVSRAAGPAMFWDAPPGVCIACGQPVTRVARESADEWAWIGQDGKQTGRDPDLARLEPDPYAYLAGLASRMDAARTLVTVLRDQLQPAGVLDELHRRIDAVSVSHALEHPAAHWLDP